MLTQECRADVRLAGVCSDCGMMAQHRITSIDGMTHSTLSSANPAGVSLNSGKYFQAGAADSERKRGSSGLMATPY